MRIFGLFWGLAHGEDRAIVRHEAGRSGRTMLHVQDSPIADSHLVDLQISRSEQVQGEDRALAFKGRQILGVDQISEHHFHMRVQDPTL